MVKRHLRDMAVDTMTKAQGLDVPLNPRTLNRKAISVDFEILTTRKIKSVELNCEA